MTAALQLTPEELRAIVRAEVVAALALVPRQTAASPRDESSLSTLPHSKRRRACERRKAALRRSQEIGSCDRPLSTKPESVRRRKSEQNAAAAHPIGSIDPPPHVVHGEARDQKHGEVRGTSDATGPLAGTVAGILGRSYGATNLRLRKGYQAIRAGVAIGSKGELQLGEMWAKTASEKADARLLVEHFTIPQIRDVAVSVGATWTPDAKSPRVTVGLVLSRLVALRDGSVPKRRQAKPVEKSSQPALDLSPGVKGELQRASPAERAALQPPGLVPAPPSAPTTPVQIAEPSPASSAEALAVLELVNATAARCRAFRGRP